MKHFKNWNLKHLYSNELDKAGFAHDDAYYDSKNLAKRTISDKVLRVRAYEIAKSSQYDRYERALESMVFNVLAREAWSGSKSNSNKELSQELHELLFKKFSKRRVYVICKCNLLAANLTEMGPLSFKNQNVKHFLCVKNFFTKYASVKPLKDKRGKPVLHVIKIVNKSNRKPNKSWVDEGRDFYDRFRQKWLHNNDILMRSTYDEGTSVIAERFIKTLRGKSRKKNMTAS